MICRMICRRYFLSIQRNMQSRECVVSCERGRGKIWKFWGEGNVNGEIAAEAEYSAMIITQDDERRRGGAA